MNPLPITVEEFKNFFINDFKGFWQPYPTWKKTVFDTGDYALYGNVYYVSLVDKNIVEPNAEDESWEAKTSIYEPDKEYEKDSIVFYGGDYFYALEKTSEPVTSRLYWQILDKTELENLFPNARKWAKPIAYKEEEKVICDVNFSRNVYISTISDNYYDPKNPLLIPAPEDGTASVNAWDKVDEELDCIYDSDIERAMQEAAFKYNYRLFGDDERGKMIALYLTAFFLVYDRRMAASGLNSNATAGPITSRKVGDMSVSYSVSNLYSRHSAYEFLSSNDYGRKAFNLMLPYLCGNVMVVEGRSTVQ